MYVCTCCMCVYMCLCVYICMYLFNSVHMGRDQKLTMGLFLTDLHLVFWDTIFHWIWSSPNGSVSSRDLSFLPPQSWAYRFVWPLPIFKWMLEIKLRSPHWLIGRKMYLQGEDYMKTILKLENWYWCSLNVKCRPQCLQGLLPRWGCYSGGCNTFRDGTTAIEGQGPGLGSRAPSLLPGGSWCE